MQASVIVPTLNRCASLAKTLHSLVAQRYPSDLYEVVVVDNGSIDETRVTVDRLTAGAPYHRIRYVHEPEPGLLAGRHRGVREAEADLLVFVDDDVRADPGWLSAIVGAFEDPTVQIVGGRSFPDYQASPPEWIGEFWSGTPYGGRMCVPLSLIDLGDAAIDIDPTYAWGLNFAIRRRALLAAGGFHPDSIPDPLQMWQGDGETGLALKARAAGMRAVYVPAAVVHHAIPPHRLVADYFERRAFYQGVCDSFTELRNGGRSARFTALQSLRRAGNIALSRGRPRRNTSLKLRVSKSRRAGYRFHRHYALMHPEVLSWVRRANYWDYALPELGAKAPVCTLLMLITPPEMPIVRYTVPALKHPVACGNVAVILFANGLSDDEEAELARLARGLPHVRIQSNRDRVLAQRDGMRIGEWYVTEAGRRELRVGLYESAPEVWERELLRLGTRIVGIIDADFEFLSGGFLQEMLAMFDADQRVAVVSTDWDSTRAAFDSYSGQECVVAERHHTWCCLYSAEVLRRSHDFSYFEEIRTGTVYKHDHSTRLQAEIFQRGFVGRVLPRQSQWQYVHYGAFAQNRTLGGFRLALYRQVRTGRHNGWLHHHRVQPLATVLRAVAAVLYLALGFARYEKERSRYRWE